MQNTSSSSSTNPAILAGITLLSCTTLHAGSTTIAPKEPVPLEPAADESSWMDIIKPTVDIRGRYEYVDTDGRDDAWAATLRARLGLLLFGESPISFFAEYEGTYAADRDSYQAASVHGLGQNKSIIADPESDELNRLWVQAKFADTVVKAGRQRIIVDNARFIGNVGWRQNEQTFDAVTVKNDSIEDLSLLYGYINRVNRIFGSGDIQNPAQTDFDDGNSHIVNAKYTGLPFGSVTAYGYFLDLTNDAGAAQSNNTFGISLDGAIKTDGELKFPFKAEFAYQTDAFDSPLDYEAIYYHAKFGMAYKAHSFGVGYEVLGSDNGVGFRTPLATLHAFNGFNDVFLNTPGEGLSDLYLYAGTKLPGDIITKGFFHFFGDDGGSFDFGNEVDLVFIKPINKNLKAIAKFASYQADDFSSDEQLATIELNITF